jgi:Cytochrome c7 and related cytochrome c
MLRMRHRGRARLSLVVPVVALLLLLAVVLSACSFGAAPTPTATPKPPATATPLPAATAAPTAKVISADRISAIRTAWQSGAHNNAYDLYKGPNTYCAVCHSPLNWDPKATVNVPPNCFSCKFPTDKEVRISPKAPLIAEADWKKIDCAVCHRVSANNVVDPAIAAWNNGTKSYDVVASSTALCEKCHVDSLAGTSHQITMGGGAHSNQMGTTTRRPWDCTECHDAHSLKADCKACHAKSFAADTKTPGHDAAHAKVTCTACHDSSGAKAAPVDAKGGLWYSQFTSVSASSGRVSIVSGYSHEIARAADCTRCHYNDNPWKLRSLVPTPTPKPATAPAATPTK